MACYQNLLGIFPNFFDFKLHCGSLYLTGWHPNGFKQGFNSWSIPHVLLKHTINILTDSAKRKVRMSSANLCDIQRNLPPNRYRTARCRLMVELIDSLSGNFTARHRIYRASCRLPASVPPPYSVDVLYLLLLLQRGEQWDETERDERSA